MRPRNTENRSGARPERRARLLKKALCAALAAAALLCVLSGCSDREETAAAIDIPTAVPTEYVHPTPSTEPTAVPTPEGTQFAAPTAPAFTSPPAEPPVLHSKSGLLYTYDSGLMRVDNAAFEPYGYVDSAAALYAEIVGGAANRLAGIAKVYSLIIPAAIGVTMPDDVIPQLSYYEDMGECIERAFSKMPANVNTVSCYNTLRMHRNEYIYFRTDHHWTAYGAYFAYRSFMIKKGVVPYPLEMHEEVVFEGFLGSLYSSTGKDRNLLPADSIHAYYPVSANVRMVVTYDEGITKEVPIVYDADKLTGANKYCTFAGGDNPITVFTNPNVTDGSVLVVLKESFANPLMAFLCDHYSKIIEIDYRHWTGGSVIELAIREHATDLLFATSIGVVSSRSFLGKLAVVM